MRISQSLVLLSLIAVPGIAAAQHTKAGPPRVAGIAPPPPPSAAYEHGRGYGQHYDHQGRGTVIVTPNGTVIVAGRHGNGQHGRSCTTVQNGYSAGYGESVYPAPVVGITQPTVYQPQPGVAQPMPYTPPVPNQQTASQQMAANPGQPQQVSRGCW